MELVDRQSFLLLKKQIIETELVSLILCNVVFDCGIVYLVVN